VPLVENNRGEGESNTKRLELHEDVAVAILRSGYREFAADEKLGRLARDRRQIGFGERVNEAELLHRSHDALDIGGRALAILHGGGNPALGVCLFEIT